MTTDPSPLPSSTSTADQHARALAQAIARLARVSTSIDNLLRRASSHDSNIVGLHAADTDVDLMLAEAEDDLRLGAILFEAVESAVLVAVDSHAQASRGISKRPRHVNSGARGRAPSAKSTTQHDAVLLKAARVLQRALQTRFPLTWPKLLEET